MTHPYTFHDPPEKAVADLIEGARDVITPGHSADISAAYLALLQRRWAYFIADIGTLYGHLPSYWNLSKDDREIALVWTMQYDAVIRAIEERFPVLKPEGEET